MAQPVAIVGIARDHVDAALAPIAAAANMMILRWCPQRDSNPCYRLERAASWASRR